MNKIKKNESGRSMVEMLGVLAVIGVLSVAGIAGYSNAMKKHRANEILNEASKRAVMVAAQAMTGKTGTISLDEFGNNSVSGITFSQAEIKENHIVLTLSGNGLADNCAQLKTATGDNTVMKITKDDCSELTFNADMSVGSSSGTGNESGTTTPACDPACTGGKECVNGTCECPDDKPVWNVSEQECEERRICGIDGNGENELYVPAFNRCIWHEDCAGNDGIIKNDTCICPNETCIVLQQKETTTTSVAFGCLDNHSYPSQDGFCNCVWDYDVLDCIHCTGGQPCDANGQEGYGYCCCGDGYHFDNDAKDCVPNE